MLTVYFYPLASSLGFERANVYDETTPLARDLAARLQAFAESKRELPSGGRPRLSAEERERLRRLGYIGRTGND